MGSRGTFIDVNKGNFNFSENGQHYETIGEIEDVKILNQRFGAVKMPEYSHSLNSTYAVIQNGKLKHLTFYDEGHKQVKSINFQHTHVPNKVMPHIHFNLAHDNNEPVTPPSASDWQFINKIKKGLGIS